MARTTHDEVATPSHPRLHVALELSLNTWKLALTTCRTGKARIRDVKARDLPGFLAEIQAAKARLGLPEDASVVSCYEAGRDGFWIHRFLEVHGIENVVIDPASIEVNRRSRRPKTDRLDAQKLVQLLARHHDWPRQEQLGPPRPLEKGPPHGGARGPLAVASVASGGERAPAPQRRRAVDRFRRPAFLASLSL